MDSIANIFQKISSESLQGEVITKQFIKGTLLQKKGDLFFKMYFVKKGILRSYTIDEKGKEHNFIFAPEGWVISDIDSIVNDQGTNLFVDVLEDCEVEIMDKERFLKFIESNHSAEFNLSLVLLRRIAVLQKRVLMLMSASAEDRYLHFLDTYPNIFQRISQKMIASYLGITPQALSTIRHHLSKKK